ncbi:hypothetical protein C8046_11375 [Serinibacter arcticus]|uniref:Thiamine-binding protein domain-containing protein n=1 Tax=Serinibacter arcticus TaxID=1655435 RepID=A0A2U1ZZZ2_9MICO|nr:thiamine-binding protein [Serinibacter arcticus]PWD52520.1 hypothetical protein C8046_11375 [Serinibacter arcticus]
MLIAFSVAPSGSGEVPLDGEDGSVAPAVAAALRVVRASGLPYRLESMFTTLEGEWDECLAVIKAATDAVAAYGSRVSLVMKADIRPGHTGQLTAKVERVESILDADGESVPFTPTADEAPPSGGAGRAG